MPSGIKRFCARPGCPAILSGQSYCDDHSPKEKPRATSTKRGYDSKWKRTRDRKLIHEPLCHDCRVQGQITQATEVHHILALRKGGPRLDPVNLMSLCKSCHSVRTQRGE